MRRPCTQQRPHGGHAHTDGCRSAWWAALAIAGLLASPARAENGLDAAGVNFFETHIRPVLVKHCYECHSAGAETQMGGLRLDTAEAMRRGGDHGAAIVPGSPQASTLIGALHQRQFDMPPDGKLPDKTIARFEQWVQMGAPDPRGGGSTSQQQSAPNADGEHWAFSPPVEPPVPKVSRPAWAAGEIDRFVLARLEQAGLDPVDRADRRTLIRRLYFDLLGIPPGPEAIDRFLSDQSPHAYRALVERLLASPRFGERWGRHWLDVARYAESTGHERNFLYPHAWRYRDYVIAAFNQDKPYNRFIREQIAGDKLPADSPAEADEQRIATGFLALGPRDLLERNDEEYRLDQADDQINVTSRAILGLTVACARCHDHKFEPISTKEYYSLAGILLSTEALYGTVPGTGGGNNKQPRDLLPVGPDAERKQRAVERHEKKVAEAKKQLSQLQKRLKKLKKTAQKEEKNAEKRPSPEELADIEKRIKGRKAQLKKLKAQAPDPPAYAMGVRDADEVVDTQVRISGSPRNRGEKVPRGLLTCATVGDPPAMPEDASGRLTLARWLASTQNPLTARVMSNRVWHHLMGRGLVSTVDNFGLNGEEPSHPRLLDWLATDFVRGGWSVKRMIRQIVLSETYRLSAAHRPENQAVDPANVLLWRHQPQRLEGEAIRDAMLAVSGQLTFAPPPGGSVVARLGNGCLVRQIDAEKLVTEPTYRSAYLPMARFFAPEMLQVFDGAAPSLVVGARDVTNVPSQSLFLLNNDFPIQQSIQAARALLDRDGLNRRDRIAWAYRRSLGRLPDQEEARRAEQYLQRSWQAMDAEAEREAERLVWAGLFQALFASAEFRYVY